MSESSQPREHDAINEHWFSSGNSASSLCDIMLARIDSANARIGAVTDVIRASAVEEARAVDANLALGFSPGRIAGWPILIKDNIDTVPAVCAAGLPFLHGRIPSLDAEVVRLLRSEGAVVLGVTYTDSGAFGVTSPEVTNPEYPELIVGGSSGGSAAAVAAGLCFVAIGTDTGGSVRIPAACCGIVGFKPTRHSVSLSGVRPLAPSFDHIGLLSSSQTRIQSVWNALDTPFSGAKHGKDLQLTQIKVGIPCEFYADAHDEVLLRMTRAIAALRAAGVTVEEVALETPDAIVQTHLVLCLTEAAFLHANNAENVALTQYPEIARSGIVLGQSYSSSEHLAALKHNFALSSNVDRLFDDVDFLLLPTLPISPPKRDVSHVVLEGREISVLEALIRYTCIFDQTGHPAIALPIKDDMKSSPGSIQVVGRRSADHAVLAFAQAIAPLVGLSA